MAEGTESALEHGQGGHGRIGRADEDPSANERAGLHAGGRAGGPAFPNRAAGRQGYFGFAPGDSAQGSGRGLEGSGFERPQPRQAHVWERSGHAVADVAIAVVGSSRDDSVFSDHGAAAGGGAEDQEFLHQVAAGAAEDSATGNDGTSHHAADADVSEDRERCVLTVVGWQAAFADGDFEISEAAGASASAAPTTSASQEGQRS